MKENKQYYSASTVMRNIPDLMCMDLVKVGHRNGYQWVGPYRLTGERYGYRKDKLKVYADAGKVWVLEEGEPRVSIQQWLVQYGGCADYSEAAKLLRLTDPLKRTQECVISLTAESIERGKYVDAEQWRAYKAYELDRCPLYTWMCRMFGEKAVAEAFDRYAATTNERGDMVYWYVDATGCFCHDKVMSYKWDGHRDKTRGGWRRFTTSDGYTNRCYYGSHLLAEGGGETGAAKRVLVVEGEKTAIMCSIVWPEHIWIATGGKNQLHDVDKGWTLLPDVDATDEWSARGQVSRWWEAYDGCGEHSDVGDMVEAYVREGRIEELRTGIMQERLFNKIK